MLAPTGSGPPGLGLQRVPEPRTGKNRVHVDLGGAIYAGISKDKVGAGLGAERQQADCRELAARLGWTVGDRRDRRALRDIGRPSVRFGCSR